MRGSFSGCQRGFRRRPLGHHTTHVISVMIAIGSIRCASIVSLGASSRISAKALSIRDRFTARCFGFGRANACGSVTAMKNGKQASSQLPVGFDAKQHATREIHYDLISRSYRN